MFHRTVVDQNFLYTLAEIAAAFAGFSTLVAFIAARQISDLEPTRVIAMLSLSIMVVVFCLLPALPQMYGLPASTYWYFLCGFYASIWACYYAGILRNLRHGGPDAGFGALPFLNKLNTFCIHPLSIAAMAFGASGTTGLHPALVYVTGLFVMLILSAQLFIQIVLSLTRTRPYVTVASSSEAEANG